MLRRLTPLLLLALPLLLAPAQAQDAPSRGVELRVVALCRGYVRPMTATAQRIANVEGVESCEMLGFGGDTARYRVSTKLDNEALAKALQLNILGGGEDFVTLAAGDANRAKRAEARGVATEIALAIGRQPKPQRNGDSQPLFEDNDSIQQRMERLELNPDLLDGTFYHANDYHIEEHWEYNDVNYRIWAGDRDESVVRPAEYRRNGEPSSNTPNVARPESRFVGINLYRSPWSANSMRWLDAEGLTLAGDQGNRSETNSDGELYVRLGAEFMLDVMSVAVAFLVREPESSIDRLPAGYGWSVFSRLDRENPKLNRRGVRHYDRDAFALKWREEEGIKIANLRAHDPTHAFYLDLEVDATAVVEDYRRRVTEEDINLADVQDVELGDSATWICGAEESVEVFRAREREAQENFKLVRHGLAVASKAHALAELCGTLDDAALLERLGITLGTESFAASDYTIRAQMLGDVEVTVGSVRTGGRYWLLVNAASGEAIRGNR